MMRCRPVDEALNEEQNRRNEQNLQALEELKASKLNDWLSKDTIKEIIGKPLLLALYEDEVIIGFALLALNETSSYLPEVTRNRYGLVDWIETRNQGVRFNCAVEIYNGILDNFCGSGLWVFYDSDSFAQGFGSRFEKVGKSADGKTIAMLKV